MTVDWRGASDELLWSCATHQRDGDAFGQLFERHADAIYNYCFRWTGNWSTAEDLTSVVFLEAWRRRNEVSFSGESVLPWLLVVASYAARNAQRTLRRHARLLKKLPRAGSEPDFTMDADHRIDAERQMARIHLALRGLGDGEREVLSLCDWAGLSYAEAANALGIPIGTVRSRLSRARQHIRELSQADATCRSPVRRLPMTRAEEQL